MALGPIYNANTRLLTENSGTLPDVSEGILNYMQPMTFDVITKTVVNFQVVETTTPLSFYGMWQQTNKRRLDMKDVGERKWNYYTVHTQQAIQLTPDDVVIYLGKQYRVLAANDYNLYGYFEYELVDDYIGAGPTNE